MSQRDHALNSLVGGLAIILLGASVLAGGQGGGLADEAKRFHASERALERLVFVAELHTGVTVVSFEIDPEVGCRTNYGSSVCPIRTATRLEALRAAGRGDVEPEVRRLHPVADFNGDGFVNDEEGKRFGILVHFGQELNYLVTSAKRSSADLARLMRLNPEEFRSRLHDYQELRVRAKNLGIEFVEVPSIKE